MSYKSRSSFQGTKEGGSTEANLRTLKSIQNGENFRPGGAPQQATSKKRTSEAYSKYVLKPYLTRKLSACQLSPSTSESAAERIAEREFCAYNTIVNKKQNFRYCQRLSYPFESISTDERMNRATQRKDLDRLVSIDTEGGLLDVSAPKDDSSEEDLQIVSALALNAFCDPISGAPVFSVLIGDVGGHVDYLEVSASSESDKLIRRSKKVCQRLDGGKRASEDPDLHSQTRLSEECAQTIKKDLGGREVIRRINHSAYVKGITALTSVTIDPNIKCLVFLPNSSPSTISYLTANQRVVKLFRIRREGFSPLDYFPEMEPVLTKHQDPLPRYARYPSPKNNLPVKVFCPLGNSIQQLSLSPDMQTFMSVEDLQIFWWDLEASDTTKGNCIVDLHPPSGNLDEVEELVTAASFHPTHGSLFLMSRSSGAVNIGDLRDPPSRKERKFAISTKVKASQNPVSSSQYDEILCCISSAAFLSTDHIVTRDYFSMKLWDVRKPDAPCQTIPIMKYMAPYLEQLYENDSIFDRFLLAVDTVSQSVVTGAYDGVVMLWEPLSAHPEEAQYYKADTMSGPSNGEDEKRTGQVTLEQLEAWTDAAFPKSSAGDKSAALESTASDLLENKVLFLGITPGGERFAYGSNDGKQVYVFERDSA